MAAAATTAAVANTIDSITAASRAGIESAGALAAQSAASVFPDDAASPPPFAAAPSGTSSSSFFGSGSSGDATAVFGSVNSVFARIAFIFLLMLGFYLLGSLGIAFLGWYTRPDRSPILINGMLNGNSSIDIVQDPSKTSSVLVSRSNNESTGAEFSWSVWLFLNPPLTQTTTSSTAENAFSTIFTKGSGTVDAKTGVNSSNGPGMYVRTDKQGACELGIAMDVTTRHVPDWIRVPNMPIQKWVHVLVRLENMQLLVYVNASVAASHTLSAVPRQNYYDVHVCPNGGFAGSLSNLRYFDHAVEALQMRALLGTGPNTAPSTATTDASKAGGTFTYLSDHWYL